MPTRDLNGNKLSNLRLKATVSVRGFENIPGFLRFDGRVPLANKPHGSICIHLGSFLSKLQDTAQSSAKLSILMKN